MAAIIRQKYTNPEGISKVREMHLTVDMVHLDDPYQTTSVIQLNLEPSGFPHGDPQCFEAVSHAPTESIRWLIDGKRTFSPVGCNRTRLLKPTNNGRVLELEEIQYLGPKVGDPISIASDLSDNPTLSYGIIQSIDKNTITLYDTGEIKKFYKGAIVQNLSNRWHKHSNIIGAKSQLTRPGMATFSAKKNTDGVLVKISIPLNRCNIKFYEIYIRNHPFVSLEPHWVPDAANLDYNTDSHLVCTYNGGTDAGGGSTKHFNDRLYCCVVAKDQAGFINVNESQVMPMEVKQ